MSHVLYAAAEFSEDPVMRNGLSDTSPAVARLNKVVDRFSRAFLANHFSKLNYS